MLGDIVWKLLESVGLISSGSDEITEEERQLARRVQDRLREEPIVFKEHKGFVTQLSNDAVEIDHKWVYQLEINDRFVIGDRVHYKVYKTRNDFVVKDVVLLKEKELFVQKSVTGVITEVNGSIFSVSCGLTFNLSMIRADFLPQKYDVVKVEGDFPKDKDDPLAFDLDYSFFIVKRVVPSTTKLVTGTVKSFNPTTNTGFIENGSNLVEFHRNVCDKYVPSVNDRVVCNAIETLQDSKPGWRAETVSLNESRVHQRNHFFVVSPVPKFHVILGETKTVEISVSNHGRYNCKLLSVEIATAHDSVTAPDISAIRIIQPQTTKAVPVEVVGDRIGRKTVKIKWQLASKTKNPVIINSSLHYEVVEQDIGSSKNDGRSLQTPVIIPGRSKPKKPVFRRVPFKAYLIPETLRELVDGNYDGMLGMQIALQKEKPSMGDSLKETNYDDYMHTLLFLEELAEEKRYDKLETQDFLYKLKDFTVFSFPMDSPYGRLVCGDSVLASKPWEQIKYEGKIWEVTSSQLLCKFNPEFDNVMKQGAKYDLAFKMNRTSFRRRHQALDIVLTHIGVEWLFPGVTPDEDERERTVSTANLNWINSTLNTEQRNAVTNILAKKNLPNPYIIYGPPGTGKTLTVVEMILQVYATQPDSRILVAAPTNSAVDTLGVRLLSFGVLNKEDLCRVTSYNAYKQGTIAIELSDISFVPSLGDPTYDVPLPYDEEHPVPTLYVRDMGKHRISIGTTAVLAILNSAGLAQGYFTHVIIDEAGQCTEPDTLLPIALVDPVKTQLVLAGDPMQLGPTITSSLAQQYGFSRSFLDRLTSTYLYRKKVDAFDFTHGYNPRIITRLVNNYRSLPKIVELVGGLFYESDLHPVISQNDGREAQILREITLYDHDLSKRMDSVVFINVNSREEQERDNFSFFNSGEVLQVVNVLNCLYDKDISPDDIGVITPYSLQVRKIYALLDSLKIVSPKVASVEEFQGQERDIIILSLVRNNLGISKKLSPFVTDSQRINVALSRARVLNVIIGNRNTLTSHPIWIKIISKCYVINLANGEDKNGD